MLVFLQERFPLTPPPGWMQRFFSRVTFRKPQNSAPHPLARKLRLYACLCYHRDWKEDWNEETEAIALVMERWAEGVATPAELEKVRALGPGTGEDRGYPDGSNPYDWAHTFAFS